MIAGYFTAVAGASPVWIAGFFAPPPAAIGATPICISGWSGSGGGGGATTSVWSASDAAANGMTLSNGGMTVTLTSGSGSKSIRNTISRTSGKMYIEFLCNSDSGLYGLFGAASSSFDVTSGYLGIGPYSGGIYDGQNFVSTGFASNYTVQVEPVANDVWALAIDFTAGSIWISRNNTWVNGSNPGTGTLPILSFVGAAVGALFAAISLNSGFVGSWTLQPTAASQTYAPPAGFSPWG